MNVENNKFLNKEKNIREGTQDNMSENTSDNTIEHNFSKEKSILFLVAALIIGVIIISYAKDNFLSNYFKTNNDLSSNTIEGGGYLETYDPIKNANEDTDGDGVANWREIVNDTDPDTKDSGIAESLDSEVVSSSSNFTSLISRDLYAASKYKEKYEGLNIDSLSSAIGDNYSDLLKPERQIILNTAKEDTLELIKRHGNVVASMFLGINLETDTSNFKKESDIKTVTENILKFKVGVNKICLFSKEVKDVPRIFSENYRTFMYNCDHMVNILDGISKLESDEVKALLALKAFEEVKKNMDLNFSEYKNYFLNNGKIKFTSDEYGYVYKISN